MHWIYILLYTYIYGTNIVIVFSKICKGAENFSIQPRKELLYFKILCFFVLFYWIFLPFFKSLLRNLKKNERSVKYIEQQDGYLELYICFMLWENSAKRHLCFEKTSLKDIYALRKLRQKTFMLWKNSVKRHLCFKNTPSKDIYALRKLHQKLYKALKRRIWMTSEISCCCPGQKKKLIHK